MHNSCRRATTQRAVKPERRVAPWGRGRPAGARRPHPAPTCPVGRGGAALAGGGAYFARALRRRHRLAELALRDELTGAPNRRAVLAFAREQLSLARRLDLPLTLALIDMDRFKQINDRHGHAVGDRVLDAFVRAVSRELRGQDRLGRWGGEEWLLVVQRRARAATRCPRSSSGCVTRWPMRWCRACPGRTASPSRWARRNVSRGWTPWERWWLKLIATSTVPRARREHLLRRRRTRDAGALAGPGAALGVQSQGQPGLTITRWHCSPSPTPTWRSATFPCSMALRWPWRLASASRSLVATARASPRC